MEHRWRTDRTDQYASKEKCFKLNKQRRNIHSRFQRLQENQKKSISKFGRPCPGDKPNDAQIRKKYSSLYPVCTEDQFQANSKKN